MSAKMNWPRSAAKISERREFNRLPPASCADHPVLAALLGLVHGGIGAIDHAGLVVLGKDFGDAGTKRDQYFFVVMQEEHPDEGWEALNGDEEEE